MCVNEGTVATCEQHQLLLHNTTTQVNKTGSFYRQLRSTDLAATPAR
jgi:hypothetical protein